MYLCSIWVLETKTMYIKYSISSIGSATLNKMMYNEWNQFYHRLIDINKFLQHLNIITNVEQNVICRTAMYGFYVLSALPYLSQEILSPRTSLWFPLMLRIWTFLRPPLVLSHCIFFLQGGPQGEEILALLSFIHYHLEFPCKHEIPPLKF